MNKSQETDSFVFQVVDGKQLSEEEIDIIAEIVANMIYENSILSSKDTEHDKNNFNQRNSLK